MRYGFAVGSKVYHKVFTVFGGSGRILPGCHYRNIWYDGFKGSVTHEPPPGLRPCKKCFREERL